MGKIIMLIVVVFSIAFALNHFDIVDIPLLDFQQEEQAYDDAEGGKDYDEHVNRGRDATRKMIEKMDKNSK
jgi:hypothetical protein